MKKHYHRQYSLRVLSSVIVIICNSLLFSQIHIIDYKETGNTIQIILRLDSVAITPRIKGNANSTNNTNDFMDEGKPGEFSLPHKNIFLGVPFGNEFRVIAKINKIIRKNFDVRVNPIVERKNTNELTYNFNNTILHKNEDIIVKCQGYTWIDGIYSANFEISQYRYEEMTKELLEISDLEITLIFDKPITYIKDIKRGDNFSISKNDIILNKEAALNFNYGESNRRTSDSSMNWVDFQKTYIKISTARDAVYRVTFQDLLGLNLNPSFFNPKTFKIFNKGKEIPIFVFGEEDEQFNDNDFIEFVGVKNSGDNYREISEYGKPYNEYLNRYSDSTIYWLSWEGEFGVRTTVENNSLIPASLDTIQYYNELIHIEKDNWFDFAMADQVRREMPNWFENKTWNEGLLNVGTRSLSFSTSDVFPERPVYVLAKLQSYASNISSNAHLLAISINSESLQDSAYIDKYEQKVLRGEYNSSKINIESNILKVHSFATQASLNSCFFDWYEIEYPRWLKTYNDSLLFSFPFLDTLPTLKGVKITNVSSDSIVVWKYGKTIKKYQLFRNSNNEIVFFDTLTNQDKFVLIKGSKVSKPKLYYAKKFDNLRNSQNQADYLAITHKNFLSKSKDYAAFISNSYNVTTKVIDVEDIYDEFAYGYFNPEAIKDFLIATHNNWQTPSPKYVCLIGGATYDYHGNKTKFLNTPPKYNFVPSFGASVSDNWFVTWDTTGAYIPQMNIGRIPVTSEQELDYYMTKHINYVSRISDSWNKRFTFFSGGTGDNQSQLDQLREVNNYVINTFVSPPPVGGNSTHFYKTINPNTNFGPSSEAEFQKTIDEGSVFISYLGHSGTQTWDNSITTPSQLKSKGFGSPLITDFGCSTARFGEPDVTSFSQLFVVSNEGEAIAYIGNSSLGFLSTSLLGPKLFYEKVLKDSVYTISEALKLAKLKMLQSYGSTGVYQLFALTNTLIGDPIVKLPIPNKPNLSISPSDIHINSTNPSDLMDSLTVSFKFYNYGKVTSDSFAVAIEDKVNESTNFSFSFKNRTP